MRVVTYSEARNNLKQVLDTAIDDVDVTMITRRDGQHAVVMGQEHYSSLIETLYLLSSPQNAAHLAQSIQEYRAGQAVRRALLDIDE